MTWKPCPLAGPPSAWIEIAASACARFPIAARRVMHGPQPVFVVRVSTTRAPRDVEVVRGLLVAVVRRRADGVARLPERPRVHEPANLARVGTIAAVVT